MTEVTDPVLIPCAEEGLPEPCEIRRAVSKLLDAADVRKPPVPLHRVAALQGIRRIVVADLGTVDGWLVEERGVLVAKLNRAAPPYRRRYSLAHEIAHTMLGDTPASRWNAEHPRRPGAHRTARERACDAIAAELLLPYHLFQPRCRELGASLAIVKRLADDFDASLSATAIRMAELTSDPIIIARWAPVGPPQHLTLEWSTRSRTARGCYIPRGSSPPPGSTPLRAIRQGGRVTGADNVTPGRRETHYTESEAFGTKTTGFVLSMIHLGPRSKQALSRATTTQGDAP